LHLNVAAALLDDGLAGRESQAGALARKFRREERFKQMFFDFLSRNDSA
jgi:hypothetical protein